MQAEALKRSTFDLTPGAGPVLVGPQSALELEWQVVNNTGEPVHVPSPAAFLRLRVSAQGRAIPARTEWTENMTLRTGINRTPIATNVPFGSARLPDLSSLSLRASTMRLDGSAFDPGEYVVELAVNELQDASTGGARTIPLTGVGFPIQLRIVAVDSLERQRQFHILEGAFYKSVDPKRTVEHYAALVSLPGALWTDSLGLAWAYGDVGRHGDACAVFKRVLPDLTRAPDGPRRDVFRPEPHLRRAAMSCAAHGDRATATNMLKLEGRTPRYRIPAEIDALLKSAPKVK